MRTKRGCMPLTLVWLVGLGLSVVPPALAQEKPPAEWDTTKARGQTRDIDFETSEGTWMSLSLSPDGNWIVFDLLGHIHQAVW